MASNVYGMTLPLKRGANGYFETTRDIRKQIQANLTNLLLTQKGERPMQPEYGSTLAATLFELQADEGLADVQAAIETAVGQWMPFVSIEQVQVKKAEDQNRVFVQISYRVIINNITDILTLVI